CGAHHWAAAPAGIYKVRGGHLFIAVLQNQWANFCKRMGRPDLGDDPRFADNTARVANREALNAIIDAWLATFPNAMAAADVITAHHAPAAPILSVEEAINHPHLIEREVIRTVHDDVFGDYQVPGM